MKIRKTGFDSSVDRQDLATLNLVSAAQVGDAVYAARLRTYLLERQLYLKPNDLHRAYAHYESARFQASVLTALIEDKFFDETETDILKRARNQTTQTKAKNATQKEYRYATALEAIIGYYTLMKNETRLDALMQQILKKCGE